jgi:uncharacterized membrane protein YjjP (DUF1212 family)
VDHPKHTARRTGHTDLDQLVTDIERVTAGIDQLKAGIQLARQQLDQITAQRRRRAA